MIADDFRGMRRSHVSAVLGLGLLGWGILVASALASSPGGGSNTVVRFQVDRGTNRLGLMDVELFDADKPETVRNFLLYVRSGAYTNDFLHRCVPGFIVQGGGFMVTNPLDPAPFSAFFSVTNYGRLTNEFGTGPRLSNTFGTIAMAKVGNDPNSATSQWFFNLGDNSANLDAQNGGFTVFGRVLDSTNTTEGTNILQHFNTLSTNAGIVNLGNLIGSSYSVFSDLPVSYTNTVSRRPTNSELYYVRMSVLNETNTAGSSPPTVAITSPLPGARYTNQAVQIRGVASDDLGVARVVYHFQGGALEGAIGTNNWTIGITPQPGFNTVSVESIDWEGNRSASASVTFYYVSRLPLQLAISGQGKVAGLTNQQLLQAGSFYSATAKPARGYFFHGWTGVVSSASASLTFQVASNATNVVLGAAFLPDFFPRLAGSYAGLMRDPTTNASPGLDNTGFWTLSLGRKGGFSGRIRHRGGSYSFTGRFDRSGAAFLQGSLGGVSRTINLLLDTTNTAGVIRGNVSGGSSASIEVQLERLAATLPATNAPLPGDYPFVIPPASANASALRPGGHGFGRATLSRRGSMTFRGTLGDGTRITGTVRASRLSRWPLYLSLDRGQGVLQGWVSAVSNQVSNLQADLEWIRGFDLRAPTYPAGFSNQVALAAQRYSSPAAGRRFLNWVTGQALLAGANLVLSVTNTVRLNLNNTISVPAPNPVALQLNIDLGTGLVGGSFVHPWLGTTNALHGVLFKPGESIRGQFLDGNQTGSLTVDVAPFLATQSLASVTVDAFTTALAEGGLIRFEADGFLSLTNAATVPYDTLLDPNGHQVVFSGGSSTRLFEVPTNVTFSASGITFADGRYDGTNGTDGAVPQPGGDACGAGILNLGGVLNFTNCTFTNFVVQGGAAGTDTSTNGLIPPGGRALGAAICNRGGTVSAQDCAFADNRAIGGPGNAPPLLESPTDSPGVAAGGAIFSDGPFVTLRATRFRGNEVHGGSPRLLVDGTASGAGHALGGAVAVAAGVCQVLSNDYRLNLALGANVATNTPSAGQALGGALFLASNVTALIERSGLIGNGAYAGSAGQTAAPGDGTGGAIYSAGNLQLNDCTLSQNAAQGGDGSPAGDARGGALAHRGPVTLRGSTLNDNLARGGTWTGAGPAGSAGGLASGGAIDGLRGALAVTNCTLAFNQAFSGSESGGVLTNGNVPGDRLGGAIAVVSNATTLTSVTLAFNQAGSAALGSTNAGVARGGAILNSGASVLLRTSLLVSNAPSNWQGSLGDGGYNFSSDASVALVPTTGQSQTNVDVLLGPLADNGGPTRTMALALGSPARDRVPANSLPSLVDQRGVDRPQPAGGLGDAGALETTLTNAAPVFIPPPPASAALRVGTNFTLQATALATNPFVYFWIKDSLPLAGATNGTLTLFNVQPTNAGSYALVATNFFGAATSGVAVITVDASPFILIPPSDLLLSPGATNNFIVTATGPGLSYLWLHDGVPVGFDSNVLLVTNAGPADRGGYQVIITNFYGATTSRVATLSFDSSALAIVAQPDNAFVAAGQDTNFVVVAQGIGPIAYQWFFAGGPLSGGTNAMLVLTNVSAADEGIYQVVVTNAYLALTSSPAVLTLVTVPAAASLALQPALSLEVTRQGANLVLTCAGIPGGIHRLLRSPALDASAGRWEAVATNQAGATGRIVWTMPLEPGRPVFYRAVSP